MSITPAAHPLGRTVGTGSYAPSPAVRRVRHQARDVLALMAFSAVASVGIALLLLLLATAGRQAS
ncbi:hypothetical protein NOCA2120043 [metagenome]|uniref:Uncharacterized protein n=1 Tax=metagenome TaxID=256318 RepID=A0A2P2BW99_9ZZZZ